jgi:Phytanoyl-CoA dioxygenase (PhyH)
VEASGSGRGGGLQNPAATRSVLEEGFAMIAGRPIEETAVAAVQPRPRLRDPRLEAGLERDGYAVADFLTAEEVARAQAVFDSLDTEVHRQAFGSSLQSSDLDYRRTVDRELKRLFAPHVEPAFNGYRLCFANFTLKRPMNGLGEMPFHQDPTFVDESRFQSLGIWCPLVDVDEENGCLFVVPGSQRLNLGPRGPFTSFPYEALVPLIRERFLQPVRMRAGQALVFCQKLFHTSPPNRGAALRVCATALLAPAGARLRFYDQKGDRMEVFEVDDLFYTRHVLGAPPRATSIGFVDYAFEPLDAARLAG